MITPSFGLTATERVLPRLALDWTTGLAQPGVDVARAGVATFVGSDGLIQSATADTQRIDYSTGTAGLLVEESRTNLVAESEDFSGWTTQANVLIIPNAETAPDGATTASKYTLTFSTGRQVTSPSFPTVVGVTYTLTLYIKAIVTTTITFDGVTTSLFASDGWKRVTKTFVADSTSKTFYMFDISGGVGDRFYFWGFQVEAGAFATSYIPTSGSAVTRNADVATMTGTNFSDWFNATEGTLKASLSTFETRSVETAFVSANSGNNLNQIALFKFATSAGLSVRDGTTQAERYTAGAISANTVFTLCGSYKENLFRAAKNGGSPTSPDTSGTLPTPTQLQIGRAGSSNVFNGIVRSIYYWPQSVTPAELSSFSKQ